MQLKGLSGPWSNPGGSRITMKDYRDYKLYLAKARTLGVKFLNATVEADLWGEPKKYTFYYRDPWEWILSLVTDPGLARVSQWQSRRLYYCENGEMERYVHEPFTADRWHEVDSELPAANPLMHCWLPLHIWLDKGLVTSHVKMFPIVLRALWLPSEIRNASGPKHRRALAATRPPRLSVAKSTTKPVEVVAGGTAKLKVGVAGGFKIKLPPPKAVVQMPITLADYEEPKNKAPKSKQVPGVGQKKQRKAPQAEKDSGDAQTRRTSKRLNPQN
ncbi:hypothetical protein R3P38DRAFT_3252273 [Favolaschia claudopus]|uniref:Uncharacterized protein n=1 Tax=Favolaschia claudopus TaxID=2862362 RepID=A0AAW0E0F9_9AGAR